MANGAVTNQTDQTAVQSSSILSPERESVIIQRITTSVVNSLKDGTFNLPANTATQHSAGSISNNELRTPGVHDEDMSDHEQSDNEIEPCIFNDQPMNTGSLFTPISAMVDAKIKQKIWNDKYVDLALLRPQNNVPDSRKKGLQFQLIANSTLAVVPNKPKFSIYSIEHWTTAFLRYIAIYPEKYPEGVPHLIKHAEMVRELATSNSSNAWLTYDQKYRMDRQARNTPWGYLI